MNSVKKKRLRPAPLGRPKQHLTQTELSDQDSKLLLTIKQLVEKTLEQSHETKFKGKNMDSMKKYNFDINVPTGAVSKLGIKLTRKQTVDETRLSIRKIDIHNRPFADCSRQQPLVKTKTKKYFCDLFGSELCPDCLQVSDQNEFTQKQEIIYPKISVHTGYMIAGGKLTKKKTQTTGQAVIVSPFQRQVDLDVLEGVVTEEDILHRLKDKQLARGNRLAIDKNTVMSE